MKLTIICVTYNSSHIITKSLELLDLNLYKVIIVDNASSDDTVAIIKENFPQIEIIENKINSGFCRANNKALQKITTDYALILNPDAMIENNDINKIIKILDNNPDFAIAGPIITESYPKNSEEISNILKKIDEDYNGIKDNFRKKLYENCYSVRFVIGAALFLNMKIMKKIGFLDENIFMYYDDDEICYRVNKNGYHNVIVTDCTAYHAGGKSSNGQSNFWVIYKKFWHMNGWSKLYWKKIRKGKIRAKRSALKLSFKYLTLSLKSLIFFNKEDLAKNLGSCAGSFSFLIGLSSFKKNGQPRG